MQSQSLGVREPLVSPFAQKQTVEAQGEAYLLPLLQARFVKVQRVDSNIITQKCFGDWVGLCADGTHRTIELKTEEKTTGNLFIETWSNYTKSILGWGRTLKADELWYFFLDTKELYLLDWNACQSWLFKYETLQKYDIREVRQGKTLQHNDTYGYLVSVRLLMRHLPNAVTAFLWDGQKFVEAEIV